MMSWFKVKYKCLPHYISPHSVYNGNNNWMVRLRSASARDAGFYTCTASNNVGSADAEMSLQVIRTQEKYREWGRDRALTLEWGEDDIHHDETVVSGDISDPEFIEALVSDMIGATYVNKIRIYSSNRR